MAWPLPDPRKALENDRVAVVPTDIAAHGRDLFKAACLQTNGEDLFVYHPGIGPFVDEGPFLDYLRAKTTNPAELLYTVIRRNAGVVGAASLMNLRPEHGTVEVGSIWYAKKAQRTEVNTNAMYLLFCYVFDQLGYRRLEWKCHNANEASRNAAVRLGFHYEGLFRNHFWDKGKNRDTAWFSIIDTEWPGVRAHFESDLLKPRESAV